MASYKDPANLKFNPYVQTLPVEAMAKVGMYKQQRYDQGVQRIQQSIDNVAGLDVVRPQDKEYLQSKLNQLGSQLSSVAGGDFSNFQLVNSVNGMTNQIAKDPRVIKDVMSSSLYKKALENRGKLIQEGKGSASNDFRFNKEVNSWMDGDNEASFNSTYRPYKDYNNSARDIIKTLGKKTTGYDVAFNEKGQLVDAITRVRVEGISKERIQAALKQGLSPDDYEQMQTDALYKYSNTSVDSYTNDINASYTSTFTKYSQERDRLNNLKNSAASATEKQKLQNQINEIDLAIEFTKSEYDNISKGFESGDVEGSQVQLYTTNWFEDTANAFSTESSIRTYETNPFAQMQMKRDKIAQDASIEAAKLLESQRYNDERLEIEQDKLKLLKDPYGSISLPTNKDATSVEVIAAMEANRDKTKNSTLSLKNNYKNKYKLSSNAFKQDSISYETSSDSISWDKRGQLNQYILQQKQLTVQNDIITRANLEADKIFDKQLFEGLSEDLKNLEINGYNSTEAILKFKKFGRDYFTSTIIADGGGSSVGLPTGGKFSIDYGEDKARKDFEEGRLSDQDYGLYTIWAASKGSKEFNKIGSDVKNLVNKLENENIKLTKKIDKDKNEYIKNYYQQNYLINQEQAYRIPLEDAKQKDQFRPVLNSLAIIAERSGGLGTGLDVSSSDIMTAANKLESALVTTNSDGNYNIIVTKSDDTDITIPIGKDQYYEAFGDRFEASPAVSSFNQMYLSKMLSTPSPLFQAPNEKGELIYQKTPLSYYSTSTDGEYNTTLDNSFLSGPTDFPNVKYYGLSGNIVSDANPKDSDSFKLQLNVYDPVTKKFVLENYLFPARIDKASLVPTLQQISTEAIWQLLNNTNKEIPNSLLKELEEASKKMQ
jgi:hypothetical protein